MERIDSLNDAYERDEIYYWCSACGDINIPTAPILSGGRPEDLQPLCENLYKNYWSEGSGCLMYVVHYRGQPAMALGVLFDNEYMAECIGKEGKSFSQDDAEFCYACLHECAEAMTNISLFNGLDILVGNDTDPDGHELLVIVPYDQRERINLVTEYVGNDTYQNFEKVVNTKIPKAEAPSYLVMFNTAAAIAKMPHYRKDWANQLADDFIRAIHLKSYPCADAKELECRLSFICGEQLLAEVTENDVVDLKSSVYTSRTEPVKFWGLPTHFIDADKVRKKADAAGYCIIPFQDFYNPQDKKFSGCYIEVFACGNNEKEEI